MSKFDKREVVQALSKKNLDELMSLNFQRAVCGESRKYGSGTGI